MIGGARKQQPKDEKPQLAIERPKHPAFADLLRDTDPTRLAEIRALSPKKRAPFFIEWFKQSEPEEMASGILLFHEGDARAAEVDAWEVYNLVAGGSWGEGRSNKEAGLVALELVKHIQEGTEDPKVSRVVKERPRFM